MYAKAVILFCATVVVISHEIEITTPTPLSSAELALASSPVVSSYSAPAHLSHISNTYLPVPASSEVKIGSHYDKHSSAHSTYVPLHAGHSAYHSAPLYTTVAPVYSTTPVSYQSHSHHYKSYPSVASYAKSTLAPKYSYSYASNPVSHVASYPSHSYSHAHGSSYSQPQSHYHVAPVSYTVSPSSYSTYSGQNYVSYPSSTPAPLLSSTLGYDSSSALSYSVAPSVVSYSSPSYSIQEAPLKAHFSYAVPSHDVYSGQHWAHGDSVPYHGGHYGYSSHSSVPQVSYGWKK